MHLEGPFQPTVASDGAVAVDALAVDAVAVDDVVTVDAVAVDGTGHSPRDSLTAPGGELRA